MKLTLEKITIVGNNRIEYQYTYSKELEKYFSKQKLFVEYDVDITSVPESILVIPFLVNVLPISWFLGFDIYVEYIDEEFLNSIGIIKNVFCLYHPQLENTVSKLHFKNIVRSNVNVISKKDAMLFSGGVDAYTTFFRHFEEKLDLITVRGADISISDDMQWSNVLKYNEETSVISTNVKYYITSNVRDFITFEVDKILPQLGWWGKVQHGLSLTGLTAPLSYVNKYNIIYISSTYTRRENYRFVIWGSMPEIDNNIFWSGTKIIHDAAELTRQEKVEFITATSSKVGLPKVRVCYSDNKNAINCSVCEKCLRTIIALQVCNVDPNKYGFNVDYSIFLKLKNLVIKGFLHEGNRLNWKEIYEAGCINKKRFKDDDPEWKDAYDSFLQTLKESLDLPIKQTNPLGKLKFTIINTFPQAFDIYLKFRRKLS